MKGVTKPPASAIEALTVACNYRPGVTFAGEGGPKINTAEQALGWVCAVARAKAAAIRDLERIREKITMIGAPSPQRVAERQRLSDRAKRAMEARFQIDADLDRLVDLLGQLLSTRQHEAGAKPVTKRGRPAKAAPAAETKGKRKK